MKHKTFVAVSDHGNKEINLVLDQKVNQFLTENPEIKVLAYDLHADLHSGPYGTAVATILYSEKQ